MGKLLGEGGGHWGGAKKYWGRVTFGELRVRSVFQPSVVTIKYAEYASRIIRWGRRIPTLDIQNIRLYHDDNDDEEEYGSTTTTTIIK